MCTAFSSGGTTEATTEILINDAEVLFKNVDNKPTKAARKNEVAEVGKSVRLTCPMRPGHHNVEWSFEQQELPENANSNQYYLT